MKKALGGSGGMLPKKFPENFHAERQILFKIFAPKSEFYTKYDAVCAYIFDYACLEHK